MTTSTNESGMNESGTSLTNAGGAFADGLTLIRLLLTPAVMFVILAMGWPDIGPAVLATCLFIIAALTDFFDDVIGGAKTSSARAFGWFDDIADLVLITGTLAALGFVIHRAGLMTWIFAVPAAILILREIIVGLVKGYEFSRLGWPSTNWLGMKNIMTFVAVLALLASPWITSWIDSFRAEPDTLMDVYGSNSAYVWMAAQITLWVAALISLLTGYALLRMPKAAPAEDH